MATRVAWALWCVAAVGCVPAPHPGSTPSGDGGSRNGTSSPATSGTRSSGASSVTAGSTGTSAGTSSGPATTSSATGGQAGTLGAPCRSISPACEPGLTCAHDRCARVCNPVGGGPACAPAEHCLAPPDDPTTTLCIADGTRGGYCRNAPAPACDLGLVCRSPDARRERCEAALVAGAACEPAGASGVCDVGLVCVSRPDAGTTCERHSYAEAPSAAPWVDACAAPGVQRLLAGEDDAVAAWTLPFAFEFFGVAHPAGALGTVSADGWLSLSPAQASAFLARPLPVAAPDNALFPLWADLTFRAEDGGTRGSVCIATVGNAPRRSVVVQWDRAGFYQPLDAGNGVTMQVQLHEADASIDVHYQAITGNEPVNAATVGLQSLGSRSWLQVCGGLDGGCAPESFSSRAFCPR